MFEMNNVLQIMAPLLAKIITPGITVVDCTAGNGYDTLKLSQLSGETGKVYSFDIQKVAIEKTRRLLLENTAFDNVVLINDSHINIDLYVTEKPGFVIFNLGFLPAGDKTITTTIEDTKIAVKKSLDLLAPGGCLFATSYHGHENGKLEKIWLDKYITSLDQKIFNAGKIELMNQKNNPPILYFIQKRILHN